MYAAEVDEALTLPLDQSLPLLATMPEGQWFERKSGRIKARDLGVPLVALANAEGGFIIVGLHNGIVEGVTPNHVNDLRQAAQDHTRPPVRTRFTELLLPAGTAVAGRVLLIAQVEPGDHVHELNNGECYLRIGDESRRLGFAQRQELEFDRGSPPYDGTLVTETVDDLDGAQLAGYQQAIGSASPDAMLRARGLMNRERKLTVAAYLLFADHPQDRFPHAHVRVLKYTASERGAGADLTLDDDTDVRCEGSIPEQITQAARVIERLIPRRRALGSSGRFEGLSTIPRDAWLEGLVNAVVHRSYSSAGDHVRVEIFPNRIEISSPGRFPGLVNPERPLEVVRYARNPRLARVCADLGLAQELGEGIRRIFAEMRKRGLTDPIYVQGGASVRLVLSSADAIPAELLNSLPHGAIRVLDGLRRAARPLGTGQVAELAGIARPTAIRHLNKLRAVGLVTWAGDSAKDPHATWSLS